MSSGWNALVDRAQLKLPPVTQGWGQPSKVSGTEQGRGWFSKRKWRYYYQMKEERLQVVLIIITTRNWVRLVAGLPWGCGTSLSQTWNWIVWCCILRYLLTTTKDVNMSLGQGSSWWGSCLDAPIDSFVIAQLSPRLKIQSLERHGWIPCPSTTCLMSCPSASLLIDLGGFRFKDVVPGGSLEWGFWWVTGPCTAVVWVAHLA